MGTHGWLAPAMFFRLKYKVNAHAKANTDQNCSFDAVITILFHSLIYAERCRVCSWRPWCPIPEVANTEAAGLESEFAERLALAPRQYPRRTMSNTSPHLDGVEVYLRQSSGTKTLPRNSRTVFLPPAPTKK